MKLRERLSLIKERDRLRSEIERLEEKYTMEVKASTNLIDDDSEAGLDFYETQMRQTALVANELIIRFSKVESINKKLEKIF